MITPAYAPTATERVLPRLALDFTTGVLDSRVTVTRALNTATRVNSSGFIEIVNANLPRFDYRSTTGSPLGLLIEETRSNLHLQSSDISNAAWTMTDTTPTGGAILGPDGTNSGTLLTQGTAGTASTSQSVTITAGSTQTFSRYVKYGNSQWVVLRANNGGFTSFAYAWFDILNGVVGGTLTTGIATIAGTTITAEKNGWYRITLTTALGAGFTGAVVQTYNTTGNNNDTRASNATRYEWGAQAETGAFATSYIPTTTTSLTRNADLVQMTGTNFSSWYNQTQSTIVIEAAIANNIDTGNRFTFQIDDGTATPAANRVLGALDAGAQGVVDVNSVRQALLDGGTPLIGSPNKVAFAYAANDFALSLNGGVAVTDTSGTIPTVARLGIGSWGLSYLNGHVRNFRYWPQRLTNAELRAFSN